jgi:hypothetical protein
MMDTDTEGITLTVTPKFNNGTSSAAAVTYSNAARGLTTIPLGAAWQTKRNIAAQITWSSSTSSKPLLYIWEPRWTFEAAPISAISWEISPSTLGMENFKHVGICKITHVSSVSILPPSSSWLQTRTHSGPRPSALLPPARLSIPVIFILTAVAPSFVRSWPRNGPSSLLTLSSVTVRMR